MRHPDIRTRSRRALLIPCVLAVSMSAGACARPNPRYADAEVSGSAEVESDGDSTGAREVDASSGSGSAAVVVYAFATEETNGSVGGDGTPEGLQGALALCIRAAAALEAPCAREPVPVLFGVDGEDALFGSVASDGPVVSLAGTRLADTVELFAEGPLLVSLPEASVVAASAGRVWTGLNADVSSNCSGWTSGNSDRLGGAGSVVGDAGWLGAESASCGDRLPVLCLCE